MYREFYGFSEDPFNLTPDPSFLFSPPGYDDVRSSIEFGIKERKGIMVITGEVGTGKTTLINVVEAREIEVLRDAAGQPLDGVEVVVRYLEGLPQRTANPEQNRIKLARPLPPPAFGSPEVQPWRGATPPPGRGSPRSRPGPRPDRGPRRGPGRR